MFRCCVYVYVCMFFHGMGCLVVLGGGYVCYFVRWLNSIKKETCRHKICIKCNVKYYKK